MKRTLGRCAAGAAGCRPAALAGPLASFALGTLPGATCLQILPLARVNSAEPELASRCARAALPFGFTLDKLLPERHRSVPDSTAGTAWPAPLAAAT